MLIFPSIFLFSINSSFLSSPPRRSRIAPVSALPPLLSTVFPPILTMLAAFSTVFSPLSAVLPFFSALELPSFFAVFPFLFTMTTSFPTIIPSIMFSIFLIFSLIYIGTRTFNLIFNSWNRTITFTRIRIRTTGTFVAIISMTLFSLPASKLNLLKDKTQK